MKILLPVLFCLAAATSASASVLRYECQFDERVDADGVAFEAMELEFTVDTASGNACMVGNIGVVEVDIFVGDDAFTFLERLSSGAIQTTTVLRSGEAVHSRHTILLDQFVVAQHFGRCILA